MKKEEAKLGVVIVYKGKRYVATNWDSWGYYFVPLTKRGKPDKRIEPSLMPLDACQMYVSECPECLADDKPIGMDGLCQDCRDDNT